MNVYDFDETIYDGDSTVDFFRYCLIHHPAMAITLPNTGINFLIYFARLQSKTRTKQQMYRFLRYIGDTEKVVRDFWGSHLKNIKPWYLERLQRDDDVVISASPEFLIRPACELIGIKTAMASVVDRHTGVYNGKNCWGEEKVRRFYQAFGEGTAIDTFYSDSLSDAPLARLASEAFIVRGDELIPWQDWEREKGKHTLIMKE